MELRKIPKEICFLNLDLKDWELQRSVLSILINEFGSEPKGTKDKIIRPLQFLFHNGIPTPKLIKFQSKNTSLAVLKETDDIFVCSTDQSVQVSE